MSGEYRQSLLGCFSDFKVCIITYFVPCYTEGKIAEKVGEGCCLHGVLTIVPIVNIVCMIMIRQKVRAQKNLNGSTAGDVFSVCCCPLCAICQEAVEVNAFDDVMVRN